MSDKVLNGSKTCQIITVLFAYFYHIYVYIYVCVCAFSCRVLM